ncbi:ubiquinol-cytochrome-c reductase complex subunit-domain-containing protein [Hypoxylon sp. NC0597]|nr:ubiquinol-cytochrome-c reductase complex subunit-domain-containing protein [Hypoxylon sp. NC0597]
MVSQYGFSNSYPAYKSPYGPKYHYQPNIAGWTFKQIGRLGFTTGAFGGVGLFAVIYYASGIPRVQRDILQKIPFIGGYFIKEIPASDNPF